MHTYWCLLCSASSFLQWRVQDFGEGGADNSITRKMVIIMRGEPSLVSSAFKPGSEYVALAVRRDASRSRLAKISSFQRNFFDQTRQRIARIGFKSILTLRQASTRGRRIATRRLATYCEPGFTILYRSIDIAKVAPHYEQHIVQ